MPQTTELAILFAAVSGSARIDQAFGEDGAKTKIAQGLALLEGVTARHGGVVIKTIGDELMCTFPSAEAAATGACQMHENLEEESSEQTDFGLISLLARVGLHFGPAITEGNDVFGDAVNVAARMASIAKIGQIVTTQSTVEQLPAVLKSSARFIDQAQVRGKKEPLAIYELIWQQEDITNLSSSAFSPNAARTRLVLQHRGSDVIVDATHAGAIIGRSQSADVVVAEGLASRQHARVEHRRGKFFLIDQSTNGTYVENDGVETFLRRDEMLLGVQGRISLGRPFSDNPQDPVSFTLKG